jgi:hypothetical protein
MIKYSVALDPLNSNLIRIGFFAGTWVLKFLGFLLIWRSSSIDQIGKFKTYFVAFSQKIHMIAVNVVAIDLIPYSLRALF